MAIFNASAWRGPISISPSDQAIPYVEIDEGSLRTTPRTIQGYGSFVEDGITHQAQFTYYGRFNYSRQAAFLRSRVAGFNIATPDLGSFSAQGMRLRLSDFLRSPGTSSRMMLSGHDRITGSPFSDFLSGYTGNDAIWGGSGDDDIRGGRGNDIIYGGGGNDIIHGGPGTNLLYGEEGSDRFVLAPSDGYDVIYGYQPNVDFLDTSAAPGINTTFFEGDLYIASGSALLAVLVGVSSL